MSDDPPTDDPWITAEQIATDLDMNIYAVRSWFRTGRIPGERRPPTRAWHTRTSTYLTWKTHQPDPTRYDLTAADIAALTGRSLVTVRTWFRYYNLPGELLRAPNERAATWRTTRAAFDAWYAARSPETEDPTDA